MEQERPNEEEQGVAGGPPAGEDSLVEPPSVPEELPSPPEEAPPAAVELGPVLAAPAPPPPERGISPTARQSLIVGAVAAGVVLFGTLMFLAGFAVRALTEDDEGAAVIPPVGQAATAGPAATAAPPDADDDPARGPEDASVVIIEFSDFQCPFCARFFQDTLPLILRDYGERVRLVYRDFPLAQIHPFAQKAAEGAQCAFEQDEDAFWAYHDLLFANQNALDDASLKGYAQQLGLDADDFAECLDSGRFTREVQEDLADGVAAGVQGTPSFFINGQPVRGAQPYQVFQSVIEAALAEADQ